MHIRSSAAAGGRHRRISAFALLLAAAAGACLALAACGSAKSEGSGGEASARQAVEQKSVKFAKCLREHGVKAEAGTGPNGRGFSMKIAIAGRHAGGTGGPAANGAKPGAPPPEVQRAMNACKKYRPIPKLQELSPAERAKFAQKALEFARCMRSHGVDVPDPGSSGALELSDINPRSATFEAAQRACHSLVGRVPMAIRARGPAGPGGAEGGSVQSPAPAGGGGK